MPPDVDDLRREIEVYAAWPDRGPGTSGWRCGSGYLLGGRLILTAAHVVSLDAERVLPTVRVRVGTELVTAEVAWHRPPDEADVALLVVTEPEWAVPRWRQPVCFGRLVTNRTGQECRATGFPAVVAEPRRRDSHVATGTLNPGSLVKAGRYAMEVTNAPAPPGVTGSRWAGMSGAALCAGAGRQEMVIGVITADPAGFDSRRLTAVPITAIADDDGFRQLIEEHCGRAPVVEAVEFAGLCERAPAPESPAGLLRADAENTPFRPRPEFDRLYEWCQSEEEWSSTRLLVGPAGQGKTRLARHLAEQLAAEGWAAVLMAGRATDTELAVLRNAVIPTLVVVDYVEGRIGKLSAVLDALADAHAKTRLLLLARTAGSWRTAWLEPESSPQLELLADDRIVLELGELETTPEGRTEAWRQAAITLATPLRELDDHYRDVDWSAVARHLPTPRLVGSRYRTILAVHMHALATLLQAGDRIPNAGDEPEQVLLRHEEKYWQRVAKQFEVSLAAPSQCYLAAAATLWCAADAREAHELLGATPFVAGGDAQTKTAGWLATLYSGGEHYWSGMQPDALAEYLVGTDYRYPGLIAGLIDDTADKASLGQLEHGLTLLGRACPNHPHLDEVITKAVLSAGTNGAVAAIAVAPRLEQPQSLITALEKFISEADLHALVELEDSAPERSISLAMTNLRIVEAIDTHLRETALPSEAFPDLLSLAMHVHNRSVRLSQVGRHDEALTVARATVKLWRGLLAVDRDIALPHLAASVDRLAISLGAMRKCAESLEAGREAVELYEELVASNREAHLPGLARSVHNLSKLLSDAERRDEALIPAVEVVTLRRELAAIDRDTYLPALANSLIGLAGSLAVVGRRVEGLAAAQEAVELCRELVELDRDANLPELATVTGSLANLLGEVGRRPESLAASQEAVGLWREMVVRNRHAHLADLAMSIHNLTAHLAAAGRLAEALAAAQEAVVLWRELVECNRDAHLVGLARSMSNLSVRLGQAFRQADAAIAAHEAVRLCRELVERDRAAHLPRLAEAVNSQALALGEMGRWDEALAAATEAVELRRELAAHNREAHLPMLCTSIYNLSNSLSGTGRREEALAAAREGAQLSQELADGGGAVHLPLLAGAMFQLSSRLFETDRRAGVDPARRAVELFRRSVELDRDAHLPLLAGAMMSLAGQLAAVGEYEEARVVGSEAVAHFRELARRNPDVFASKAMQAAVLVAMLGGGPG